MGQTGERLRQEQWEAVRTVKLRNEMLRMAECLGEEMAGGEEKFVSLQLTTVTSSCFVGQVKKRVLLEALRRTRPPPNGPDRIWPELVLFSVFWPCVCVFQDLEVFHTQRHQTHTNSYVRAIGLSFWKNVFLQNFHK